MYVDTYNVYDPEDDSGKKKEDILVHVRLNFILHNFWSNSRKLQQHFSNSGRNFVPTFDSKLEIQYLWRKKF